MPPRRTGSAKHTWREPFRSEAARYLSDAAAAYSKTDDFIITGPPGPATVDATVFFMLHLEHSGVATDNSTRAYGTFFFEALNDSVFFFQPTMIARLAAKQIADQRRSMDPLEISDLEGNQKPAFRHQLSGGRSRALPQDLSTSSIGWRSARSSTRRSRSCRPTSTRGCGSTTRSGPTRAGGAMGRRRC